MNAAAQIPGRRDGEAAPAKPVGVASTLPRSVDTLRGTVFLAGTGERESREHGDAELELVAVQASWRSRAARVPLPVDWRAMLDDAIADYLAARPELRGYLSGAEFRLEQVNALEEYGTMLGLVFASFAVRKRNAEEGVWARSLANRIRLQLERSEPEGHAPELFEVVDVLRLGSAVKVLTEEANRALGKPRPGLRVRSVANRKLAVAKLLHETTLAIEAVLIS